jgi:hypothetical protein
MIASRWSNSDKFETCEQGRIYYGLAKVSG